METNIQKGLCWHMIRDEIMGFCRDYRGYVLDILRNKEQETLLCLFKPVKGDLPQEVIKASQACDEAWQVYDKARQIFNEARQALDKALKNNMPVIIALHKEECPNCSWDGKTIFPGT